MKHIAIFGCGSAGQRTSRYYRSRYDIRAFLDNNKSLHGTHLLGIPVCDPERFNFEEVEQVLIASMYLDQILVQLLALGVPAEKIEYVSDDVMTRDSQAAASRRTFPRLIGALETAMYLPFRLLRRVA